MKIFKTFITLLVCFTLNAQTTHTINTGSFYYTPSTLTINVGDSVIWINDGGTHDVNGNTNSITNQPFNNPVTFDSPSTSTVGAVIFAYKFTVPGTYNYDCSVGSHASAGMVGNVIVNGQSSPPSLTLTAIMDLTTPAGGNTGKAIMLTANQSISDLSTYGFGSAGNGGGSDGEEYTFPSISINAGQHVIVCRDSLALSNYFDGCLEQFLGSLYPNVILESSSEPTGNGNDAYELFFNGTVIETFGDIVHQYGTGGFTDLSWAYRDSWAWKDTASLNVGNWVYGGDNCSDGSTTTQTSSCPFPLCAPTPPPSPGNLNFTAIMDLITPIGGNSGGKAIMLTANQNISDLSTYGFGSAGNGGGSDGEEYTFPSISINAGQHIIVCRDSLALSTYFNGCLEQFPGSLYSNLIIEDTIEPTGNGNDAYELFFNGNVIETFGDIVHTYGTSGFTDLPWAYRGSWAWKDTAAPNVGNWVYNVDNCSDSSSTTQTSACPFPLCVGLPLTSVVNNLSNDILIYPNPSSGILNLKSNTEIEQYSIFNISGQLLLRKFVNLKEITLELTNLENGTYFLNFTTNNSLVTKKITVLK